jgi:hypothetical protein
MSAGGSGAGGTAFIPPNQGAAAQGFADIIQPLAGLSANAGAGTPGAWAYPQAQSLYPAGYNSAAQYLTGDFLGGQPTLYDQNAGLAVGSAMNAGNIYGGLMPSIYNQIPGLISGAGSMAGYLPQAMSNAFNPMYGQMVNSVADNPFYAGTMAGAQQGAGMGAAGAQSMYGMGQGLMMSGFDPQSALFGRGQQRTMDRANAINAMSGVGTSPYGAGTANTALTNFDLDWQNQQLARQAQAASAASPLFQQAPGLAATSAAMPSNAYLSQIEAILKALGAQNAAGAVGAQAGTGLLQGAGQGLGSANALGQSLAGNTAQFGGLPYSTGATIGSNAQSSLAQQLAMLTGITGIGNQQFQLPMQVMDQLMSYLTGGRQASQLSGNLGQQGFNQMSQGIGGMLSGANTLFNPNSGMFPGTFGSLGLGGGTAGSFMFPLDEAILMGAMAGSDRRLKRDISRIGTLRNGLPVYSFRYRWDDAWRTGLMADEVERVHPEAVIEGPLGYKLVNYQLACA